MTDFLKKEDGNNLLQEEADKINNNRLIYEFKFVYIQVGTDTEAKMRLYRCSAETNYTRQSLDYTQTYNWSGPKTKAEIIDLCKIERDAYGSPVTIQA